MKTIAFTDFRKRASGFITEVEHGETIVLRDLDINNIPRLRRIFVHLQGVAESA